MIINYIPSQKKGKPHSIEINGEFLTSNTATVIIEFAEQKGLTRYDLKLLKRAMRMKEPFIVTEASTFEAFEQDLHLYITSHPYYLMHGKVINQRLNEQMKLKYILSPAKEGDKEMVIDIRESMFQ